MGTNAVAGGWIDREGDRTVVVNADDGGSLVRAFAAAAANATSTSPWVIRLQAGVYTLSSVLAPTSYTTLVGAGRDATIIQRTTALANSVTVAGQARDPVIGTASAVSNFRVANLTIKHTGAWASGKETAALALQDAQYFSASNVRFEGTVVSLTLGQTSVAATQAEATNAYLDNCFFVVDNTNSSVANDTVFLGNSDVYMTGCYVLLIGTSVNTSDALRHSGGRLFLKSTDIINRMTSTITNSTSCLVVIGATVDTEVRIQGGRLLTDLSGGDFNNSGADVSCVDWRQTALAGDLNFYAEGTHFEYLTGTITAARSVSGIRCPQTSTNATKGNYYLAGCSIRDLGGSGGTTRADVVIDAVSSHIIKQFKQQGCRIGSISYRTSSAPAVTSANYFTTEPSANLQFGSSTFASAATAAATLSVAYVASALDYVVGVEPTANETFWVTSKTTSGFTLNSSNATSTAVVPWVVKR